MRSYAKKILFWSILMCVGTVLPAETVLRISGLYQTYTEKTLGYYKSYYNEKRPDWFWLWGPNQTITRESPEFTYTVKTNREGIRDIDHEYAKPEQVYRIITMGDSYTEGVGAEFDQSWFRVLRKSLLKQEYPIEIINGGVGGSDVFFDYQLLKFKLLKYDPDLVILPINNTDLDDIRFRGGLARFRDDGTTHFNRGPWFEPCYRFSHLIRFVLHRLVGLDMHLIKFQDTDRFYRQAENEIATCLELFCELSVEHEFKLLVLFYLTPDKLANNYKPFSEQFLDFQENQNSDTINLIGILRTKITKSTYLKYAWPIDMHFNPAGYNLFADIIEQHLKNGDLLPDPLPSRISHDL